MSVDRCTDCSRQVDTDIDVDCYDAEGQCTCAPCRARRDERELFRAMPERPTTIPDYLKAKGRT